MLTGDLFQTLTEKKKKPKPTKPDKWAYAKAEAKKKFDVYPSAYANAWAAKKYKALGGGWRMGEDAVEEEEQLNELDMWAPHTAYIRTAPGVYFKADWRQSEKLTGDDAASFIKVAPLQPQVVKSMGLDAKLNDKSALRYQDRELARGGPIGASGPLADREITLVDLTDASSKDFGAPQLPAGVAAELYKHIEKQGVVEAESTSKLSERKKKKKKTKSKKAFGGYYFPGYHYYGQGTADIGDGGGGGDGGGESMFEVITKNRTPEETGSLDSYYSRRRQPHKVVDGKRVELTDKEEIQQYLDAYENETDRKDYGNLSEQRMYFRTVATLAESLEQDFGMQKDDKGWYLTPRSGRHRILDAERAFGTPQIKQ